MKKISRFFAFFFPVSAAKPGLAGVQARFLSDRRGVAAVEFGFIATMLILMMCFWIQLGLVWFMQNTLDNAVRKESRLIKTGAIQTSGAATFSANLCTDVQVLMTCSLLQVNVATATTFASMSSAIPTSGTNAMTTTGFNPGGSGKNVLVQVGYAVPILLPIVSGFMGKNGSVFISASTAFQNEPY